MVHDPGYTISPAHRADADDDGDEDEQFDPWRDYALSVKQLLTRPVRQAWLGGLMALGELTLLFGSPKVGKSALALSIAYQLGNGRSPVHGYQADRQKVLYIAAEGQADFRNRVELLERKYGDAPSFTARIYPIDLRDPGGTEVSDLINRMRRSRTTLLVLDTLARMMAGADENSSRDMGAIVRSLGRIMEETGAAVLIVHHDRKNDRSGSGADVRGHGALQAAADAVVRVRLFSNGLRLAEIVEACATSQRVWRAYRLVEQPITGAPEPTSVCAIIVEDATDEDLTNSQKSGAHNQTAQTSNKKRRARDLLDNDTIARMRAEAAPADVGYQLPPGTVTLSVDQVNRIIGGMSAGKSQSAVRAGRKRWLDTQAERGRILVARDQGLIHLLSE